MAGIPPLAGFFSKLALFLNAIQSSFYLLATVAVLVSVMSAVYYIRIIKIMYFEPVKRYYYVPVIAKANSLVLAVSLFFIVFLFFDLSPI